MAKTFEKWEVLATIEGLRLRLQGMNPEDPASVRIVAEFGASQLASLVRKGNKWLLGKCVQCGLERWGGELHPFCGEACAAQHAKEHREELALSRGER